MHASSPTLTATLRALRGESDLRVIAPALRKYQFARVLALAPGVHPIVSALGALGSWLPDILTPDECASPALSAAIASLIGTDTGERVLLTWAKVAPAGWGASHAADVIDAVRCNRCDPWAAAALIGPCDASAALLRASRAIAYVIRHWEQATPDDPTAWMNALTPAERGRLLKALRGAPSVAASCLPWLPATRAADVPKRVALADVSGALNAYAAASPVARARHADILAALIQCAERDDLAALTRLAVATDMDVAWTAIADLLREAPNSADQVVAAAPWNDVRADVQEAILSAAPHNDVCAAIAFARGDRTVPSTITQKTARAFFAAVTRKVWDALSEWEKQAWRCQLVTWDMSLAVRSLGPDPAFMAGAEPDAALVAAVRRHIRDDRTLRHTLLPIAVRDLPPDAVPAIIAALPAPPDPVAFIQIAGGAREIPPRTARLDRGASDAAGDGGGDDGAARRRAIAC